MGTYVFTGKVLPERADFSVSLPLTHNVDATDAGIRFDATVAINNSQVSVLVRTSDEPVNLEALKNYVEDLVRAEVDLLSYLNASGFDLEITSCMDSNGMHTVFGVGILELRTVADHHPIPADEIWPIVMQSAHLRNALADLRQAIRSPRDTGLFCYRAIESLRQRFVREEDGDNKNPGWQRLRTELRIDRSLLDYVKEFADHQRHGKWPYMPGESRVSVIRCTWMVIDRFVAFAKGGFQPLSESSFELLTVTQPGG